MARLKYQSVYVKDPACAANDLYNANETIFINMLIACFGVSYYSRIVRVMNKNSCYYKMRLYGILITKFHQKLRIEAMYCQAFLDLPGILYGIVGCFAAWTEGNSRIYRSMAPVTSGRRLSAYLGLR